MTNRTIVSTQTLIINLSLIGLIALILFVAERMQDLRIGKRQLQESGTCVLGEPEDGTQCSRWAKEGKVVCSTPYECKATEALLKELEIVPQPVSKRP